MSSDKEEIELEGDGLYYELKDQTIDVTWSNKTVEFIIDDIFTNYINGKTDILYNIANINPPAVTLTTYEAKKKDVQGVLEDLLAICNSNLSSSEYTVYVDADRYIYFDEIDKSSIYRKFFEGTDFQAPKIKLKTDKLLNSIELFLTNAASQTVAYNSTIQDTDSIAKYGEKKDTLTLPSNMDSDTGEAIAEYKIARWGEPKQTIQIKDLAVEEEKFPFGLYGITTKHQLQRFVLDECNSLDTWTYNLAGSSIFIDDEIMISGRNSFRWEVATYNSDYIQIELTTPKYFWESIVLWIRPDDLECEYQVYIEDKDGNSLSQDYFILETDSEEPYYLVTENNDYFVTNSMRSVFRNIILEIIHDNRNIALENSDLFLLENGVDELVIDGIEIIQNKMVLGDFNPVTIYNYQQLSNIKLIKIASVSNGTKSYLDRIELSGRMFNTNTLTMEKIKYKSDKNQILCDIDFGEIEENAVDKIKEIKAEQKKIYSIFEKD
jgi:hypothetical protein